MRTLALITLALVLAACTQDQQAPTDNTPTAPGLVVLQAQQAPAKALDAAQAAIKNKGLTVFARIDHAAGAQAAGLAMPATQLLIFGNPKVGTPLMQAGSTLAIDLPMKLLAWTDADGKHWVAYNAADYLQDRHQLGDAPGLQTVREALAGFAAVAARP